MKVTITDNNDNIKLEKEAANIFLLLEEESFITRHYFNETKEFDMQFVLNIIFNLVKEGSVLIDEPVLKGMFTEITEELENRRTPIVPCNSNIN